MGSIHDSVRTTDGASILAAPPHARWALLCEKADCAWQRIAPWRLPAPEKKAARCRQPAVFGLTLCAGGHFFRVVPKTHREVRWWTNMLLGNRRVFLLHALVFVAIVILRLPEDWETALAELAWPAQASAPTNASAMDGIVRGDVSALVGAADGGRRLLALLQLLPLWLQLAPLASVSGRTFEYYEANDRHRRKAKERLRHEAGWLAVSMCACVGAIVLLPRVSGVRLATGLAHDWRVGALLISWLSLIVIGPRWTITALLFPIEPQASYDDNLLFERRSRALLREWWWKDGSWGALRPEVLHVGRMYAFWVAVWTLKAFFAASLLVPTAFSAHSGIANEVRAALSGPRLDHALGPAWMEALHFSLVAMVWLAAYMAYMADTLLFYQIMLGIARGTAPNRGPCCPLIASPPRLF